MLGHPAYMYGSQDRGSGVLGLISREIVFPLTVFLTNVHCGIVYETYRELLDQFCLVGVYAWTDSLRSYHMALVCVFLGGVALLIIWRI